MVALTSTFNMQFNHLIAGIIMKENRFAALSKITQIKVYFTLS